MSKIHFFVSQLILHIQRDDIFRNLSGIHIMIIIARNYFTRTMFFKLSGSYNLIYIYILFKRVMQTRYTKKSKEGYINVNI